MSFIGRFWCFFTNWHRWTDWAYTQEGKCEEERVCERPGCSASEKRIQHEDAQPTKLDDNPCMEVVNCKRCGQLQHKWPSHDFKDGKCQRCGESEPPSSSSGDDDGNYDWSGYSSYRSLQGIPH